MTKSTLSSPDPRRPTFATGTDWPRQHSWGGKFHDHDKADEWDTFLATLPEEAKLHQVSDAEAETKKAFPFDEWWGSEFVNYVAELVFKARLSDYDDFKMSLGTNYSRAAKPRYPT